MNKFSKLVMALAMTIFGTIGIFRRFIPVPSATIAFVRGIVGTIVLLLAIVILKKKIDRKAVKSNLVKLFVSGALIGFNWMFLFEAYRYTTVATATLCYYMAPVLVVMFAPLFLKEKMSAGKFTCIAVAFVGMVFVSGVFSNKDMPANAVMGIAYGLIAACMYAAVVIINKKLSPIGAFEKTIVQLGSASLVLLPYILITGDAKTAEFGFTTVLLLLFVGTVHTGIAYALYFGSMDNLKANSIAILSYIDPLVAIILSVILLDERMSLLEVIGACLILGATLWSELFSGKNS